MRINANNAYKVPKILLKLGRNGRNDHVVQSS